MKPPPPPPPPPKVVAAAAAARRRRTAAAATAAAAADPAEVHRDAGGQGKKSGDFFGRRGGLPLYAAEGELVLGQYRVVRIGVESVVMEYLDGRGRQTIPMRGDEDEELTYDT